MRSDFLGTPTTPAVLPAPLDSDTYLRLAHVHTPQGRCIKNRYGTRCRSQATDFTNPDVEPWWLGEPIPKEN